MLANLLAVIVGLGSLGFYLAAFILPEVHRRSDFFWSGVGMFYAVVLWYCARQMSGAVLLGQTASVGLLIWLGYQTLLLRRETTPTAQQTPIRLGKSERSRLNGSASRPIAKDYEFVEDGVEDAVDQDADPNSPILIKPTADEFAPKIVVPAAIPKSHIEKEDSLEETLPKAENPPISQTTKKREIPNPIAAVGIFVGWLKEVVTPKKKEPKPMIELPPRPPSIPKADTLSATTDIANITNISDTLETDTLETSASVPDGDQPNPQEETLDTSPSPSSGTAASASLEPRGTDTEDSNWPDDDFWD
ncbi:hypothetical protein D0962_36525 [Leptolyngbyaceae cyanobacterium CCMR0082]|uniref:Ycf66 n=2 Tax=Adonisia turfae TaxID=2950184 RepID=A0A6M0SIM5_9CYAN|nr:Ycf66 family protein [Adonisia turfae]NEZ57309.1 hypothetical protein [Adonisia turfae CCMR0081]NEZ68176.1 hypothetical protein [Adonisia turfae CCMR0082]